MPECIQCGAYTKFINGLCPECYHAKENQNSKYDIEDEEEYGLSDKKYFRHYNMIKGRIAETLIQELFLSLGFKVFAYGMENTIPGIMELLAGVQSDVAQEIRRMPDFVIQNPNNKDVHFIEVKFKANGNFRYEDLKPNYPYKDVFIIVVSKKHIKCLSVAELKGGKEITANSSNYLGNRKEFDLDKEVIKDFCEFAILFFEGVCAF